MGYYPLGQLFRVPALRRTLLVCSTHAARMQRAADVPARTLQMCQQLSGINAKRIMTHRRPKRPALQRAPAVPQSDGLTRPDADEPPFLILPASRIEGSHPTSAPRVHWMIVVHALHQRLHH